MRYQLEIPPKILKKLEKMEKPVKERIFIVLTDIMKNPEKYKPLRYELKGLRSARVGKWRIIYRIDGDKVIILSIAHRKKVYE
jgi:mRNA interferase RelE/StbE